MMKSFRPLILFVVFVLLVGVACMGSGGGNEPAQPAPVEPQAQPTQAPPEVTEPPAPVATEPPVVVTEAPAEAPKFYTEEFDEPLSGDWDILTVSGSDESDPDKVTVEAQDGNLVWDFESEYVYYYLFNNTHTYDDVKLEVTADNRGRNNNSVSLICRYDPEVGWYEFNIANNGLYDILYGEVASDGDISYTTIANGGSNEIKQGKDVNEYAITCEGDKLTLTINGEEVNSITEKNYSLRDGQVGVSVSSFDVLPILVEMDWFKVSEP